MSFLAAPKRLWKSFLDRLLSQPKRKSRKRSHQGFFRGGVEVLEVQHLAPAIVTWNNLAGGDWDTASNWTDNLHAPHRLPVAADDVTIDAPEYGGRGYAYCQY